MKIAILCNGRSGSTSLTYLIQCCLLSNSKNYKIFFEPFNYSGKEKENKHYDISKIVSEKNILLKTFIDDDNYPINSFNNIIEYWDWFFNFFDKIIILERKNKRLQAESIWYHLKLEKQFGSVNWHKQKYYDLKDEDEIEIEKLIKVLLGYSDKFKTISEKGYPLFYYEDIFLDKNIFEIEKIFNYLNIQYDSKCIDEWILSPYKKVRIETKINKLI